MFIKEFDFVDWYLNKGLAIRSESSTQTLVSFRATADAQVQEGNLPFEDKHVPELH